MPARRRSTDGASVLSFHRHLRRIDEVRAPGRGVFRRRFSRLKPDPVLDDQVCVLVVQLVEEIGAEAPVIALTKKDSSFRLADRARGGGLIIPCIPGAITPLPLPPNQVVALSQFHPTQQTAGGSEEQWRFYSLSPFGRRWRLRRLAATARWQTEKQSAEGRDADHFSSPPTRCSFPKECASPGSGASSVLHCFEPQYRHAG